MSDKKNTVEDKVEEVNPSKVKTEKGNWERWWTVKGASHSIVGRRHEKKLPEIITMENYTYDLDLDTEEGEMLAKDFRSSGFWGADLHVIVDVDLKTKVGKDCSAKFKECVMAIVDDNPNRGLRHVCAMLTNDECDKYGIDRRRPAKHELLSVLFTRKSFAPLG